MVPWSPIPTPVYDNQFCHVTTRDHMTDDIVLFPEGMNVDSFSPQMASFGKLFFDSFSPQKKSF